MVFVLCNLHYEKFADGTVKCIEDEIPFELPSSWSWCRLGVLFAHNTGKALNSSDTTGTRLTYITTSNLYWDRFELDSLKEMPFTESEIKKCTVRKGDLLVCEGGDIGRSAIWLFDEKIRIQNHIHRLRSYIELSNRFYYYVMYFWKRMERIGGQGIGLQGFSSKALHKLIVPLPPVNEQFAVVEKLDSILGSVDDLDELNAEFTVDVKCIKKQILDLAIRGKLVPQTPDDEPASALLERIKAEKEELIRQGKIKRDKKESVIFKGEDNSYYDEIPKNWAMTTLNQLTHALLLNDGDWILSENMNPQGEVKLIQLGSVGMMQYVDKGFKYLAENTFQELNCTQIYSGYMLINRIVSDKMCSCILPSIEGKLITTVDTCWVAPKKEWYNLKYLMYTLSSPTFQSLVMLNSAGTTRKRISKNNLINLPFAVPPLEEQYRIVEAIDNAFNQLDTIAESLN